ncbi:cationic amino acid transporter 4-like [Glandiceps talaboti]
MVCCQHFLAKLNRKKVLDSDLLATPLQRCLGTFDLSMLGIGSVIGAGLFVLTGTVAKNVAGPAVLLSYVIAGFVSLLAALCYAELPARVPPNAILTIANLAVILLFLIVGSLHADVSNWKTDGGFLPYGISGVISGAGMCIFAYVGFDIIAMSGEEAKNPSKSIPIFFVITLAVTTTAYLSVSCVLTLLVPYNELVADAAFTVALRDLNLIWAEYALGVGALCAIITSTLTQVFAMPRCLYAMASDGLLFSFLAKINTRTQVPIYALIASSFLAGLLAFIFDIEELVEFLSIGTLLAYTIVAACVIVLRYSPSSESQNQSRNHDDNSQDGATNSMEGQYGTLKKIQHLPVKFLEEYDPGTVPAGATLGLTISSLALAAVLTFGINAILETKAWAILLVIVFTLMTILFLFVISIHHQNTSLPGFKAPCVPYIPALSIFVNSILMMGLQPLTWIRFAVWLVLDGKPGNLHTSYYCNDSVQSEHRIQESVYLSIIDITRRSIRNGYNMSALYGIFDTFM